MTGVGSGSFLRRLRQLPSSHSQQSGGPKLSVDRPQLRRSASCRRFGGPITSLPARLDRSRCLPKATPTSVADIYACTRSPEYREKKVCAPSQLFPHSLIGGGNSLFHRENSLFNRVGNLHAEAAQLLGFESAGRAKSARDWQNSLFFPCRTGNSAPETGSL